MVTVQPGGISSAFFAPSLARYQCIEFFWFFFLAEVASPRTGNGCVCFKRSRPAFTARCPRPSMPALFLFLAGRQVTQPTSLKQSDGQKAISKRKL